MSGPISMTNKIENGLSQEEIWAGPRLKFLERVTTNVSNGAFPSKDDYDLFFGLPFYIQKELPGFETVQVKFNGLKSLLFQKFETMESVGHPSAEEAFYRQYEAAFYAKHSAQDDVHPSLDEALYDNKKVVPEDNLKGRTSPDDEPKVPRFTIVKDDPSGAPAGTTNAIETNDGLIAEMNKYFATGFKDDKFKVAYRRSNGDMHFYTETDFIKSFRDQKRLVTKRSPGGGTAPKEDPVSIIWLEDKKHKKFHDIIFDPSRVSNWAEDTDINLFRGFAIRSRRGQCYHTLMYIRDIVCNGDKEAYRWLCAWGAHMFQRPWEKPETSIAIHGEEEGTGKSFFPWILGKLLDGTSMNIHQRLYFKASNSKMITGDFSGHLEHCLLLHAEEAFRAESEKEDSIIKELISGPTGSINAKGIEAKLANSFLRLILTGNPPHIVKVSRFARRFLVLKISALRAQDTEFFAGLVKELKNGGFEALMYYFMHYPIEKFNLRIVKKTDALLDQTLQSASSYAKFWYNILNTGELPFDDDMPKNAREASKDETEKKITQLNTPPMAHEAWVLKRHLLHKYQDYAGQRIGKDKGDAVSFGRSFQAFFPNLDEKGKIVKDRDGRAMKTLRDKQKDKEWYYIFPSLKECRAMFDAHIGQECHWPANVQEWTFVPFKLF